MSKSALKPAKTLSDCLLAIAAKRNDPEYDDRVLDDRIIPLAAKASNSERIDALILLQDASALSQFDKSEKVAASEVVLNCIDVSDMPKETAAGRFLARHGWPTLANYAENIGQSLKLPETRDDLRCCASIQMTVLAASAAGTGGFTLLWGALNTVAALAGGIPLCSQLHNDGKLSRVLRGGHNLNQNSAPSTP